MARTKKELENELVKIGKKLDALIRDFADIKKKITTVRNQAQTKQDIKKISDLKNKILSL